MKLVPLLLAAALLLPATARAADEVPAAPPATAPALPDVDPAMVDLLPIHDLERAKLHRDHGEELGRFFVLQRRIERVRRNYVQRKDKTDDGAKKLRQQLRAAQRQFAPLLLQVRDRLEDGAERITPALIEAMNAGPRGAYRMQRYAQRLVLLADLGAEQRALLGAVVERLEGAYAALVAQKKRIELALEQTEVAEEAGKGVLATFDQQLYRNERRFWRLVDWVLDEPQRARLGRMMPPRYQDKANVVEHLYELPDLTPSQGAQLRSLLTELEAESAPDAAAIKRIQRALAAKDLDAAARKELHQERAAAQKRQVELQLFLSESVKALLTPEQLHAYYAIPPRVSANDRRERVDRVLQGMPLDADQRARVKALGAELREAVRAVQKRTAELRRMGADYGPDSPQQMMMQTMMAGMRAEGAALTRGVLGRVFLEVLRPDQVSAWVLGVYGDR